MEKIKNWSKGLGAYRTDKGLLELSAKLVQGPTEKPYMLLGDDSKVGIELQDYSKGTGDKNVIVRCNISTGTADLLYEKAKSSPEHFSHFETRIWGSKDENGLWDATRLQITRNSADSKGKPMNYPWFFKVENGKGIKVTNPNGSSYCKKDSFKAKGTVTINLSDADFFIHFSRWSDAKKAFLSVIQTERIEGAIFYEKNLLAERAANKEDSPQKETTKPIVQKEQVRFKNLSALIPMTDSQNFCMEGNTADGKVVYLIFPKKLIDQCSAEKWNAFKSKTDQEHITFSLAGQYCTDKNGKMRFFTEELLA